jgi:hypothetical protein
VDSATGTDPRFKSLSFVVLLRVIFSGELLSRETLNNDGTTTLTLPLQMKNAISALMPAFQTIVPALYVLGGFNRSSSSCFCEEESCEKNLFLGDKRISVLRDHAVVFVAVLLQPEKLIHDIVLGCLVIVALVAEDVEEIILLHDHQLGSISDGCGIGSALKTIEKASLTKVVAFVEVSHEHMVIVLRVNPD